MIHLQKKLRGLGVAAVGFVCAGSSFLLVVFARLVDNQLSEQVLLSVPVNLIGAVGLVAGILLGGIGVVATWLSIGNPNLVFNWLIRALESVRVSALRWLWKPALWTSLLATAVLLARGLTGLADSMAANLFLAAGVMLYAALQSTLVRFLIDELRRLSH